MEAGYTVCIFCFDRGYINQTKALIQCLTDAYIFSVPTLARYLHDSPYLQRLSMLHFVSADEKMSIVWRNKSLN